MKARAQVSDTIKVVSNQIHHSHLNGNNYVVKRAVDKSWDPIKLNIITIITEKGDVEINRRFTELV